MTRKEPRNTEPIDPNTVLTAANVVTIVRIFLVPVFICLLLSPWPEWFNVPFVDNDMKRYLAAVVFIIISCTDWLDGYLARSRNEVTNFGKFMDPLADKILVVSALVVLVELGSLPSWVVIVILAREFIVAGVRMIAASEGQVIAASYWGKFKTVFQMIAIVLFTIKDTHMTGTFGDVMADKLYVISWLVMFIALAFTIISMCDYVYKARHLIGFGGKGAEKPKNGQYAAVAASPIALDNLARTVVERATKKGVHIATAESLTGGLISATLTAVPGSSAVVNGGIVSYVNDVKRDVLGVDAPTLATEGAVCERVACDMARGAREKLGVDVAVSVTGIAGPTGAEEGKPVGTVWMGVSTADATQATCFHFDGARDEVRAQTVAAALQALLDALERL